MRDKKQVITEAATQLFIQNGYSATSMEEIRQRADVSKGSIYYYFKSKEELFLYCVSQSDLQWRQLWKEKSEGLQTLEEKCMILAECYAIDMQNPLSRVVPEFISATSLDDKLKSELYDLVNSDLFVFEEVMQEGIKSGEIKSKLSAEQLARMLHGSLSGISMMPFLEESDNDIIMLFKQTIHVFLNGIKN